MSVFDDVSNALADLLGTTSEIAGFFLGFVTVVVLLIIVTWVLGDSVKGIAILIPAGIAVSFIVLVGWWPLWTVIFIVIIAAVVISKMYGGATSGLAE